MQDKTNVYIEEYSCVKRKLYIIKGIEIEIWYHCHVQDNKMSIFKCELIDTHGCYYDTIYFLCQVLFATWGKNILPKQM